MKPQGVRRNDVPANGPASDAPNIEPSNGTPSTSVIKQASYPCCCQSSYHLIGAISAMTFFCRAAKPSRAWNSKSRDPTNEANKSLDDVPPYLHLLQA